MWDLVLSGKGPTNNVVTLSILRPTLTFFIRIAIQDQDFLRLEGVEESHDICYIFKILCLFKVRSYSSLLSLSDLFPR
jgi:hypothetical protein